MQQTTRIAFTRVVRIWVRTPRPALEPKLKCGGTRHDRTAFASGHDPKAVADGDGEVPRPPAASRQKQPPHALRTWRSGRIYRGLRGPHDRYWRYRLRLLRRP